MGFFTTNQEDDIALRGIDVCIFQQKHSIYAILLQHRELDEQADWAGQLLTEYEVLLAPSLHAIRTGTGQATGVLTPSSKASSSLRALSLQWSASPTGAIAEEEEGSVRRQQKQLKITRGGEAAALGLDR